MISAWLVQDNGWSSGGPHKDFSRRPRKLLLRRRPLVHIGAVQSLPDDCGNPRWAPRRKRNLEIEAANQLGGKNFDDF